DDAGIPGTGHRPARNPHRRRSAGHLQPARRTTSPDCAGRIRPRTRIQGAALKIRRIDPHRLEVMTGTDRHLLTPAAPVAHFTDGKARVRVSSDSGTMEVQL